MIRDQLPRPTKRHLSLSSSSRFFSLVDAVAKYNEPTSSQLEALERSYGATARYVMESEEFSDLTLTVHAQGSRANGTLVRPMKSRPEGFDVDIVIRLSRAAFSKYGESPEKLINDLHTVLNRYAIAHGLKITRWERCITLEYADGMCVDITPIIDDPKLSIPSGATHARVPDRTLHVFEPSNPMGLANAFSEAARVRATFSNEFIRFSEAAMRAELQPLPDADQVQSRLLSRLVQMLKLHRNIAFGPQVDGADFSPKSVFITSLAATAYAVQAPIVHDSPLDLLLDIVDTMPLYFQRVPMPNTTEFWLLPNLTAPGDNLASGMNSGAKQQAFFSWHARLKSDLQGLLDCIEGREGLDRILDVVEQAFGKRAAQAVRELEAPKPILQSGHRIVSLGTAAAATTFTLPARDHRFYGD